MTQINVLGGLGRELRASAGYLDVSSTLAALQKCYFWHLRKLGTHFRPSNEYFKNINPGAVL